MIRHLVFAGGGPSLLQTLGALQYTEDNKFIERENIQTIYGTSAGGIVGAIYCLKYDWTTIHDYITIRPWHDVFPITIPISKGDYSTTQTSTIVCDHYSKPKIFP